MWVSITSRVNPVAHDAATITSRDIKTVRIEPRHRAGERHAGKARAPECRVAIGAAKLRETAAQRKCETGTMPTQPAPPAAYRSPVNADNRGDAAQRHAGHAQGEHQLLQCPAVPAARAEAQRQARTGTATRRAAKARHQNGIQGAGCAAISLAVVKAMPPKAGDAAVRTTRGTVGFEREEDGALVLLQRAMGVYDTMHRPVSSGKRAGSGQRRTIPEVHRPSLRLQRRALRAEKFTTSFSLSARQTSPVPSHIARAITVNANLLRKWIMRYQQERDGASTAALPAPVETSAFVPVATLNAPPRGPALRLQARLPNGVELDLGEATTDEVSSILQMLCMLPCSVSTRG